MSQIDTSQEILSTKLLVDTVQKLSLARDIKQVMHIVRSVARQLTGADGATFVLRDGDLCYYADEDAISPLWKGSRFPMKICISGWVMLNKQPAVIEDIYVDDRIPADAYRPTFVKSLAMVPIRTIDPIGAIGNYWDRTRQPTDEEVAMLQSLADITAVSIENIEVRNRLEERLKERTRMLHQLEKQKKQLEEFTQIVAHNMRAPLSNLLLLSDMVKESEDTDEKLMYLDKQKPVIDFLHQTFDELVDAIHVQTDFSIAREYIDLEACAKRVAELLHGDIVNSRAEISYDFTEARTAHFPGKYMDSIMFNLLSNALKYRSPERDPKIAVRGFKQGRWTYLKVADNGLGIDLHKHGNKVFMLHKTFHQHPEAKGFGLFITKTQVEAMGGSISVESEPGQGSTFTVKLSEDK